MHLVPLVGVRCQVAGVRGVRQGWHHAVFYYRVLFGFLIKPDSLRGSKIGFYSVLFPDKCFNA
jgi:hypothetical protein